MLYIIMEMFSEIEQEEIINEFLNVITLKDYKHKLNKQNQNCETCLSDEGNDMTKTSKIHFGCCECCHTKNNLMKEIDICLTETNDECRFKGLLQMAHSQTVQGTETKTLVPVEHAMLKFQEQLHNGQNYFDEKYIYDSKSDWVERLKPYERLLNIRKHNNKFVCSKEKLHEKNPTIHSTNTLS